MNATKRKFNSLLQGLSSPRPSTADINKDDMNAPPRYGSSPATNDEILQKRRRLGFPESTAPTLYSPLSVTTSFSDVVLRRSAAQSNSKAMSHAPAKYCPGDRDELLKRLATFQDITDWTPKPDKINENEWAKRGWICQGKEKVRCVLCHKELVVKLSKNEDESAKSSAALASSDIGKSLDTAFTVPSIYGRGKTRTDPLGLADALVEKYSDLVVSSHQQDCLWRKRGCEGRHYNPIMLSGSISNCSLAVLQIRYYDYPFRTLRPHWRRSDSVTMK